VADKYEFLTDEWIEAARAIRDEADGVGGLPHAVKMNLVIIETPEHPDFEGGEFKGHMDSSDGDMKMDKGHLDGAELTVTVDYATAKAIFVDQNPQAGMQAFMSGKIKVEGDITKLMAMQSASPDPAAADIAAKISAITA
jgi:putative sterol carrier protein